MTEELKHALLRVAPFVIIPFALRIAIKRKRFTTQDLGIVAPVSYQKFFLWWGAFLLFISLTEVTLFRLGILEVSPWNHDLPLSIIRLFGTIVLAPVAEELLFRGLFLHKLIQWKLNKHASVLLQALVFVLLHSFTYQNILSSNIGVAQSFIDACIYAYARFNTKSIYTSMAMHSTGNFIAVLEQFIL